MSEPRREAGALIPLFSIRADRGWGIGELPDLGAIAPWLARGRLSVLMVLPIVEAALGQDSPYAALSAFAIDPVYVSLGELEDFTALGGEAALTPEDREELAAVRGAREVQYERVRRLKMKWLRRAFDRFVKSDGRDPTSVRGAAFAEFREAHAAWLEDYALFRALKEAHAHDWWKGWGAPLRDREPSALAEAREAHADERAFFSYVQFVAYAQQQAARAAAAQHGVKLAGDLPFMVAEDSADVWARQHEFRLDCTVGVPPDAFSDTGQDWGLPVYRWDAMASSGYDWLRLRGLRAATLFDLVRVDHVVGFYRTYARPRDGAQPFFLPADEPSQRAQGEAVLAAIRGGGAEVVAEDLGTVPPFVRESLPSIGVAGYRVLRWEQDDGVFRDPKGWPRLSLATTGTHDTETIPAWWEAMDERERDALCRLPSMAPGARAGASFTPEVHAAILDTVYGASSDRVVLPVQDLFGLRERINLPGSVGPHNWSYRMPWTIDELRENHFVRERTEALAALAHRHGR